MNVSPFHFNHKHILEQSDWKDYFVACMADCANHNGVEGVRLLGKNVDPLELFKDKFFDRGENFL